MTHRWTSLFLLWLFLLNPAPVRAADNDPSLTVEARVGLGGLRAPDRWTPIRIRVANRGPDFRGELRLVPIDTMDEWTPNLREVDLPRGSSKVFWMYARLPSLGVVRVTLREGDRRQAIDVMLPQDFDGVNVAVIGTAAGLPPGLAGMNGRSDRVAAVTSEDLPDRWIGYDGVDWVVVAQADSSVFGSAEQAEAFAKWVRSGERCAIVASQGSAAVRGTIFDALIPARLGHTAEVSSSLAFTAFLGMEPAEAVPYAVSSIETQRGVALIEELGHPLVLRGSAGLGETVLLTFDPRAAPFRSFPQIETFWPWLYHRGTPPDPNKPNVAGYYSYTDPVVGLLEGYPVANPVSFGWLALIFGIYVVVLWPIDWWILRRLRKPGWMWGSMLVWVTIFGSVVYFVSTRGRGQNLSLRRITVVDVDGTEGWLSGRTFAALYTPGAGRYDLTGPDGDCFVSHRTGTTYDRRNKPGQSGGGYSDQQNGVAIRSVWMWSAMMKDFEMSWRADPEAGLGVRAKVGGEWIEVTCKGKAGVEGLTLVSKDKVWELGGGVAPDETRRLYLPAGDARASSRVNAPNYYGTLPEGLDWAGYVGQIRSALCTSWIRGAGGSGGYGSMAPDAVARDIEPWLQSGGKVLLATTSRPPCEFRVAGEQPEVLDVCVVRVFIE